MKRKSPISVEKLQFYLYECYEKDDLVFVDQFEFDDRHDFATGDSIGGIAVRAELLNNCFDKGVRRIISFTLVDITTRCVTASQNYKVSIKADYFKNGYLYFPAESSAIEAGHDYKLIVADDKTGETLAEDVIHLFDVTEMGSPDGWYEVCEGGVRPGWQDDLYKSLNTVDEHDYLVQFNISPNMGRRLPAVMPELEIRIHYPDGKYVKNFFKEPFCRGVENFDDNHWSVAAWFETIGDINGVFYTELLCMDYAIGGFVFDTTSGNDVRGSWSGSGIEPLDEYSSAAAVKRIEEELPYRNDNKTDGEEESLDDIIDRFLASELQRDEAEAKPLLSLDHLTGLGAVKEKLKLYERVVRFNKMRADNGLSVHRAPLHSIFMGSPGTGKTTVAKMLGEMLCQAGVLSKGHVVVRERATLLGQNYNSESEKTVAAIEEARGGILFIDEAYQLFQSSDPRDPGKFVIETLLTALSDEENRDWMLILAGYPDEMMRMLDMNPGFRSRIPVTNIYNFDDFTESELMEIAEGYLSDNNFTLTPEAREALETRLKADYECREKNFGNARHVLNVIQTEILPSMAVRVTNAGIVEKEALTQIQPSDIPVPQSNRHSPRPRIGFTV